jgi:polyhydroxybutyrate depolymerase
MDTRNFRQRCGRPLRSRLTQLQLSFARCWAIAGLPLLLACPGGGGSAGVAGDRAAGAPGANLDSRLARAGRSAGCGRTSGWREGAATLSVTGKTRDLLVRLPAGYDANVAYPLLFGFHGAGSTGAKYEPEFALAAAWRDKAIIVYPTALTVTADGPTTWRRDSDDDLLFLDAMIGQLGDSLCIDRGRIFVAGFSSGGYFANTVGCRRGDTVRAIVTAAGGDRDFANQCRGTLAVHITIGVQDTVVPYGGEPGVSNLQHAQRARDHFVAANGCSPQTRPVEPAPCVEYQGCKSDSPVIYCEHAGGHTWPAPLSDAGAAFLGRR